MKSVLRMIFLLLPVLFAVPVDRVQSRAGFANVPRLTLWAWQRPERLEFIDPQQVAVAYLDQTLYVREDVNGEPRMQPLRVPPGTQVTAVVRIEMPAGPGYESEKIKVKMVAALLRSARRPGISALQIDFDALQSQRTLYREVLVELRREMPKQMPLSITALASWCADDDWIAGLPVDEAVPMLFRMGRDRGLFDRRGASAVIREPLCSGSLGLSTDEPWPAELEGKRLYIFRTRAWTNEAFANLLTRVKP